MWNDPQIGVEWPALEGDEAFDPSKLVLSDKDKRHPALSDLDLAFEV
jgi:dTDP-4-dehydrorhamnose 3,5-epimerase